MAVQRCSSSFSTEWTLPKSTWNQLRAQIVAWKRVGPSSRSLTTLPRFSSPSSAPTLMLILYEFFSAQMPSTASTNLPLATIFCTWLSKTALSRLKFSVMCLKMRALICSSGIWRVIRLTRLPFSAKILAQPRSFKGARPNLMTLNRKQMSWWLSCLARMRKMKRRARKRRIRSIAPNFRSLLIKTNARSMNWRPTSRKKRRERSKRNRIVRWLHSWQSKRPSRPLSVRAKSKLPLLKGNEQKLLLRLKLSALNKSVRRPLLRLLYVLKSSSRWRRSKQSCSNKCQVRASLRPRQRLAERSKSNLIIRRISADSKNWLQMQRLMFSKKRMMEKLLQLLLWLLSQLPAAKFLRLLAWLASWPCKRWAKLLAKS